MDSTDTSWTDTLSSLLGSAGSAFSSYEAANPSVVSVGNGQYVVGSGGNVPVSQLLVNQPKTTTSLLLVAVIAGVGLFAFAKMK